MAGNRGAVGLASCRGSDSPAGVDGAAVPGGVSTLREAAASAAVTVAVLGVGSTPEDRSESQPRRPGPPRWLWQAGVDQQRETAAVSLPAGSHISPRHQRVLQRLVRTPFASDCGPLRSVSSALVTHLC